MVLIDENCSQSNLMLQEVPPTTDSLFISVYMIKLVSNPSVSKFECNNLRTCKIAWFAVWSLKPVTSLNTEQQQRLGGTVNRNGIWYS